VNRADFALQIINTPAVGARPGSADELAALGLDRHLRLAESTKYQGEAGFCELEKPKKCLTSPASSWKSKLSLPGASKNRQTPQFATGALVGPKPNIAIK